MLEERLGRLQSLLPEAEAQGVARIQANLTAYREATEPVLYLAKTGQSQAAEQRLENVATPILDKIDSDLNQLVDKQENDLTEAADLAEQQAERAFWTLAIASAVGLLAIGSTVLLLIRGQITAPVVQITGLMERLASGENKLEVPGTERRDEIGGMAKAVLVFRDNAQAQEQAQLEKVRADAEQKLVVETLSKGLQSLSQGDLTADIQTEFSEDYIAVKTNYNNALSSLRELIGSVAERAESIRTSSAEITNAAEDLARRTEGNAANSEETAAALNQVDERVKATAVSSEETLARADRAIATVDIGRQVASRAVEAMGEVSAGAKDIDSVIEGLDKIAFQTRVLAMNAAVEAGRAGEAGRGFAVVADLVSALAMRAEEEAQRAREQLTLTQVGINGAVAAVQSVDGALSEISSGVVEVQKLLGSMAEDNHAQSASFTQITSAVVDMDRATQQNAAMVEETSAAARSLSEEVETLAAQAGRFDIGSPASGSKHKPNKVHELISRASKAAEDGSSG